MKNKKSPVAISGVVLMKPHLYNFLSAQLHLEADESLVVPGDNSYSIFLQTLLCNKSAVNDDKRHFVGEAYTKPLPFRVEARKNLPLDLFLTPTRVQRFNSFVYRRMHELLFELIAQNHDDGKKELETINLFLFRYRLYEHISFDTLKKAATRYREKKKLPRLSRKGAGKLFETV